jgi:hypothetical protein
MNFKAAVQALVAKPAPVVPQQRTRKVPFGFTGTTTEQIQLATTGTCRTTVTGTARRSR